MKQIFDQFLQFLQQGIAAIFRFVLLVWTWSIDQIDKMMQAPWQNWPLWKQILLIIVIAAVISALFIAVKQLWVAGVRVVAAFASFIGALIVTLPAILIAGVIALAGLWVINNSSSLPILTGFERSQTGSLDDGAKRQSGETPAQGGSETTGSRQ
ncbi:MAG: hypothetical protein ACJ8F0_05500 [Xanthobacteraceae bacterium]|jgi:hypothetical protein